MREVLDPFDRYDGNELQGALNKAYPAPVEEAETETDSNVESFLSLSSPISEGGWNLSQGQRQLLCLALA